MTPSPSSAAAPMDRWIQRLTLTAVLALAATLLGLGIAYYTPVTSGWPETVTSVP